MNVQISYKARLLKKNIPNLVLFVDEKFNISGLKRHIPISEYNFISDLIKKRDEKKKVLAFDISSKKKIILVSLKKNITNSEVENLGANFFDQFKSSKMKEFNLDSETLSSQQKNIIGYFAHGIKLKSYTFEK